MNLFDLVKFIEGLTPDDQVIIICTDPGDVTIRTRGASHRMRVRPDAIIVSDA